MVSPGFPVEMPFFTRGLAGSGVEVIGLGEQAEAMLPAMARGALAAHLQVPSLADEADVERRVVRAAGQVRIDRVECLWEPYMILAARLRERLGLPGMTVAETVPFRDKEVMKQVLDEAGIRTPKHASATSAGGCREAAAVIGFPLVVKPIAGAGSSDTYRVETTDQLEQILPRLDRVPEVSVEEFVEGEDYTFDTICSDGRILHENVGFYRPRALVARDNEWISPQTYSVRDPAAPELAEGRRMGLAVLEALGFRTGFTHMEWYRKPDGEAVFGEIAARPPGARTVDVMNYGSDFDFFAGWAEAVCYGEFSRPVERRYNAASIFKRAAGVGRISRIEGLEALLARHGPHICCLDLLPLGAPRRNWKQTLLSDGMVCVRHPDLGRTIELADEVSTRLRMYAS